MEIRKDFVKGLGVGVFVMAAWFLVQATSAWAAGETCVTGSSAPCEEDIQLTACTLCHSIRMTAGNRNGSDRQTWASLDTRRHETAPRRADWTALVQTMINKGSPAVLELTAGYLNTNYCAPGCTGPILGSPVVSAPSITDTQATVNWTTSANAFGDESTNTVLYYGTDKADVLLGPGCGSCQTFSAAGPTASHTVNLTGLTASTTYYIVNEATSGLGTTRSVYAISFRTKKASGGGGECIPATDPIPARVYFSNQNSNSPSIQSIDPATDTLDATIPVNGTPTALVAHPDGTTLYAMTGTNLTAIDLADNVELGTLIGVGDYIYQHLAMAPDGNKLYLLYRQLYPSTLIIKVFDTTDPTTPTLQTTITDPMFNICYAALGLAVSPDGSQLYLACRQSASGVPDRFFMVNTGTNTPSLTASFPRDSGNYYFINALAVTPDGSKVYVARTNTNGTSTVEYFDGGTGARLGAISLPANAVPRAGVFTPNGSKLYVTDQMLGTHVIDPATNTRTLTMSQINTRGVDIAMLADGTRAFTGNIYQVNDLDVATDSGAATISGNISPWQITTTPGRPGTPEICPPGEGAIPSYIYLSDQEGTSPGHQDKVVVLDPEINATVASITSNGTPSESVAHPNGSTVYVMEGTNLSVIDVEGNVQVANLLGVGEFLYQHLAMSPDGNKLYLVYRQITPANLIIKVFNTTDPQNPSLMTTINSPVFNVCYAPLGLAVKPDGSQLYVACRQLASGVPDRFFMVDTATNTATLKASFPRDSGNYYFINGLTVTPDGSKVYVARSSTDTSTGTVEYFDGTTGAHLGAVSLPANALPRAGVFTPDGTKLYVVDQRWGTHLIDPVSNTLTLTMQQTLSRGLDIAITPDGLHLYTTLLYELHDLYTPTNSWLATISGALNGFSGAYQITISPGHE